MIGALLSRPSTAFAALRLRYCSFCGKSEREIQKLIAGPKRIHICDRCLKLCNEVIAEARVDR